jgi:hypothetical protein
MSKVKEWAGDEVTHRVMGRLRHFVASLLLLTFGLRLRSPLM